jgi:hypothetical protein
LDPITTNVKHRRINKKDIIANLKARFDPSTDEGKKILSKVKVRMEFKKNKSVFTPKKYFFN